MVMNMLLWILALAVSFDGFGAGVAYGLRKIRISAASVLIIAVCSALVFGLAMLLGRYLSSYLSPQFSNGLGAAILMGIGMWAILQNVFRNDGEAEEPKGTNAVLVDQMKKPKMRPMRLVHIEIKRLGLVIEILRTPAKADLDRSGVITPNEAIWLGIALSLDALGAGIGAAFVGLSPILTSFIVGLSCGICIMLGLKAGYLCAKLAWVQRLAMLPGLLLLCIGMLKLLYH